MASIYPPRNFWSRLAIVRIPLPTLMVVAALALLTACSAPSNWLRAELSDGGDTRIRRVLILPVVSELRKSIYGYDGARDAWSDDAAASIERAFRLEAEKRGLEVAVAARSDPYVIETTELFLPLAVTAFVHADPRDPAYIKGKSGLRGYSVGDISSLIERYEADAAIIILSTACPQDIGDKITQSLVNTGLIVTSTTLAAASSGVFPLLYAGSIQAMYVALADKNGDILLVGRVNPVPDRFLPAAPGDPSAGASGGEVASTHPSYHDFRDPKTARRYAVSFWNQYEKAAK